MVSSSESKNIVVMGGIMCGIVKRIGYHVGGGGPGARPLKPERTATSGTKVKRTLVPRIT